MTVSSGVSAGREVFGELLFEVVREFIRAEASWMRVSSPVGSGFLVSKELPP